MARRGQDKSPSPSKRTRKNVESSSSSSSAAKVKSTKKNKKGNNDLNGTGSITPVRSTPPFVDQSKAANKLNGEEMNGLGQRHGHSHFANKKRKKIAPYAPQPKLLPAVFLADGQSFAHADRGVIKVVHISNGLLVKELKGHEADVRSICKVSHNNLQLVSCDAAGVVRLWDVFDGKCLNEVKIDGLVSIAGGEYALVQKEEAKKPWRVHRLVIDEKDHSIRLEAQVLLKSKRDAKCNFMTAGGEGNRFVACGSKQTVFVYDKKTGKKFSVTIDQVVTCVAVHPEKPILAVGDRLGQISIFHESINKGEWVPTVYHWHSQAVSSLAFSSDGAQFISGGHEAVLVIWQTEDPTNRIFLPRLGGVLSTVYTSGDGAWYAACTVSNMIRLIDARTRKLEVAIQCLAKGNDTSKKSSAFADNYCKLVVEPRSGGVVVQKTPGVLQIYDMFHDREVTTVDVTMRNVVSNTEADKPLMHTMVDQVAFALRGKLMITVERRISKSCLKFWKLERGSNNNNNHSTDASAFSGHGKYIVTTQVEQPHSHAVIAVLPHPKGDKVITASADGSYKVWEAGFGGQWTCRCVGYYRNKGLVCAALSQDGSLLALAYGSVVTLWNPYENKMLFHLTHKRGHGVQNMCFYRQNLLAVSMSNGGLFVWDILTQKLKWSLQFNSITALSARNSSLLVIVDRTKLLVFSGDESTPSLFIDEAAHQKEDETIMDIQYHAQSGEYIYYTNLGAIRRFVSQEDKDHDEEKQERSFKKKSSTTFALIKGGHHDSSNRKRKLDDPVSFQLDLTKDDGSLNLLDTYPSYVLPPVSKIAKGFLNHHKNLLMQQQQERLGDDQENATVVKRMKLSDSTSVSANNNKKKQQQQTAIAKPFSSDLSDLTTPDSAGEEEYHDKDQEKALEKSMTEFFHNNLWKKLTTK